jgi:trigger factor
VGTVTDFRRIQFVNTDAENVASEDDLEQPKRPRLDLTVKIGEKSACERHVTVSIPRTDIERYFSEKFDELVPQAEVPGFRPGKAPRRLVENRFRHQIEDQVKGALLMDSLAQINDDKTFSPISEPDFDFESIRIPDDGPMTYEFNIEVRPEFELPKWQGLVLTTTEVEIDDDAIEAEIRRLLSRQSDLLPVDEPAQTGDFVVANITSRHKGKELESRTEQLVEIGDMLTLGDASIADFGKLMAGVRAGETRTTTVTIGDYVEDDSLRGAEVEVSFEVLDVKRPERLDVDAVAAEFEFEDSDALRATIRSRLELQREYENRQEIRRQITELLTESANWEIPPDLLRRQARRERDRIIMELEASGFSEQAILQQENLLRQNVLKRSETLLKEHFILERIAETEGIEETEEEFEEEIARIAESRNDSIRRVRTRLERNGQLDALRNMIVERKVIDLIRSHATFKTKKAKSGATRSTSAIDFFVAGHRGGENIPEAKYEDVPEAKLPVQPVDRT